MLFLRKIWINLKHFIANILFQKTNTSIEELPFREAPASVRAFSHQTTILEQAKTDLPTHLALIMDGNGRYAQKNGQTRSEGHVLGAQNLIQCVEFLTHLNIPYLTVYAFSTENWKRSSFEVERLMELFAEYCLTYRSFFIQKQIRVRFMGQIQNLSFNLHRIFEETEQITKHHQGLQLILAINYSGRQDIVEACKWCMQATKEGFFNQEQIEKFSEENFRQAMYLPDVPDPDFLIRTAGEYRLSNFMLWNLAYTEIHISPKYWPEFNQQDLEEALELFKKRERRFGA